MRICQNNGNDHNYSNGNLSIKVSIYHNINQWIIIS